MNAKQKARFEAWAAIMKALAHPARLAVVDELSRQNRCVCELAELTKLDMSTMSRHLTVLRHAGVVDSEKHGTQIIYHLRVKCALNFFNCVDSVLRANAQAQMELVD